MSENSVESNAPSRPWYRQLNWPTRILLLLLGAGIILFYWMENVRGRRLWEQCQADLQAQGVVLDLAKFYPPPVPDEENFAATPLIQGWFPRGNNNGLGKNYGEALSRTEGKSPLPNERCLTDLAMWEQAFAASNAPSLRSHKFPATLPTAAERAAAAPAVLAGLADGQPALEELRRASRRPSSRYPVAYSLTDPAGTLLPHLARAKQAVQQLQLRAEAELALGQGEQAAEDIRLMACLADSSRTEPFLISFLVRLSCWQLVVQPVWEGLAERRWTEPQLQALQTRLAEANLGQGMETALAGEMAWGVRIADLFANNTYSLKILGAKDGLFSLTEPESKLSRWGNNVVWMLIPAGWFDQEKVHYIRAYRALQEGTLDAAAPRLLVSRFQTNVLAFGTEVEDRPPTELFRNHALLARMMLPGLKKIPLRMVIAQVAVHQAVIGCALERYRLAHGEFPEKLVALTPAFLEKLPPDLLTGENYGYRRTPEGSFLLYSVGWDEKDDGGVPGKELFDEKSGDWVWSYPVPTK